MIGIGLTKKTTAMYIIIRMLWKTIVVKLTQTLILNLTKQIEFDFLFLVHNNKFFTHLSKIKGVFTLYRNKSTRLYYQNPCIITFYFTFYHTQYYTFSEHLKFARVILNTFVLFLCKFAELQTKLYLNDPNISVEIAFQYIRKSNISLSTSNVFFHLCISLEFCYSWCNQKC